MDVSCDGGGLVIQVVSEEETDRLAQAMASILGANTVIGLVGTLGAGKTRFVRGLAGALGVEASEVSSPTFVLIHEYEGRLPVFHFDTYRLKDAGEFEALGPGDYWRAGGVCLVEWADRVPELLPSGAWWMHLEATGPTSRRIALRAPVEVLDALAEGLGGGPTPV